MTPLTDAVGFVDYEETDWAGEEVLEESAVFESFRSQIEDLSDSFRNKSMGFAGLRCRQMRMHRYGADALRRELVMLVLHQCDQRAHYDGESREQESGQLINHGFAAAGGHDYEGIFAAQYRIERLPLARTKIRVAKSFLEQLSG